jgi:hypothetical protein
MKFGLLLSLPIDCKPPFGGPDQVLRYLGAMVVHHHEYPSLTVLANLRRPCIEQIGRSVIQ